MTPVKGDVPLLRERDPRDARKQMRLANNHRDITKLPGRRGELDAAQEGFRKVLSLLRDGNDYRQKEGAACGAAGRMRESEAEEP